MSGRFLAKPKCYFAPLLWIASVVYTVELARQKVLEKKLTKLKMHRPDTLSKNALWKNTLWKNTLCNQNLKAVVVGNLNVLN